MEQIETNTRPHPKGFMVEMVFGEPGADEATQPYLRFRVLVEGNPAGRPQLAELQAVALQHVRDEADRQIRALPQR